MPLFLTPNRYGATMVLQPIGLGAQAGGPGIAVLLTRDGDKVNITVDIDRDG